MDIEENHNSIGVAVLNSNKDDNVASSFLPRDEKKNAMVKPSWRDVLPQVIASCIVHCLVIQAGVNMSYSTVITHGIAKDGIIQLNKSQKSWLASLVTISAPIGSLLSGPLMDRFGRRTVCFFCCVPILISWILLIVAQSIVVIYIARVVAGAAGGLTTVGLVYVSEITHPNIRPMLLCLNSVFVSFGILLPCCLTIYLDWQRMSYVFIAMYVCLIFLLTIVPESPYWLICFENGGSWNKRIIKAEKGLQWLNKREIIYEQEYDRIKEIALTRRTNEEGTDTILKSMQLFCKELASPKAYKPVVILFVIFLLQQLSGCYVVIFYAISVFQEIGGSFGSGLDEYGALVLLGIIRFGMSIVTAYFSKLYGRRTLSFFSGIGMTFSMFFSGMFLYMTSSCDENGKFKETMMDQKWLLLVIVLFYVCTSSLGVVAIPWTLIGELLPISIRGIGGGLMVSVAYIMMFGVLKSYPYALDVIGAQGVFFFFSFTSLLGTSFTYLFLPETLGKTFAEIEEYFINSKLKNRVKTFAL